jgi:hypothetical protein
MSSASDGSGPVTITCVTATAKQPLPTVRSFVTGALVLTVGLAWSSAVQATIDHVYPQPANSVAGKLIYAGALTGVSLVALEAINMRSDDVARLMQTKPPPITTTQYYRIQPPQEQQPHPQQSSCTPASSAILASSVPQPASKPSSFRRRLVRKLLKE